MEREEWSERLWSVRSGGEVVEREEWSERLWSVRSGGEVILCMLEFRSSKQEF